MVNSFGLLLDITVIINILPEVIKILLEKMLKALNDRSNEPRING